MKRTALTFTIMILLSISFVIDVENANAQRATQVMIKDLENQGKKDCEVWKINDFFYLPIRMNFSFEKTLDIDPDISSRGASSEGVFYEGTSETFQVVTNTAGIHTVGFVLDYEIKHREPRQVYYQIFSQDNTLMMEGNWVHEGFTFCKYVQFQATTAPHILTPEEIQAENNAYNVEFRKEVAGYNTTVENALLGIVVTSMLGGVMLVGILFFLIMQIKSLGKVANKPVKKLDEMIKIYRNMITNLKLVTEDMLNSKGDMIRDLSRMVDAIITDLPLVIQGKRDTIQVKESFLEPSSLIMPDVQKLIREKNKKDAEDNEGLSLAILSLPEQEAIIKNEQKLKEESEKENEELVESQYGLTKKEPEVELPPEPENSPTEELDKAKKQEPNAETVSTKFNVRREGDKVIPLERVPVEVEPTVQTELNESFSEDPEVIEEEPIETSHEREETVQVPADAKCSECKKDPEILCQSCDLLFCEKHHKRHKCKGKKKDSEKKKGILGKFTGSVPKSIIKPTETIASKIVKSDELKPYDDEYIRNALENKVDIKKLNEEMIVAYLKIPYAEVLEMHKKGLDEYVKNPSNILKLQCDAMLKRMVRSSK